MPPERLTDLIDGYLEGMLSPDDTGALEAELLASAEARRLFWECAHQRALLAELLAEARGRRLAVQEEAPPIAARPSRRAAWLPWTAVALLVTFGLWWGLRPPTDDGGGPSTLARLTELRGDVRVLLGANWLPAREGQSLRPGQELRTGTGSSAVVAYDDQSRIELNADTAVRLLGQGPSPKQAGAKRVYLLEGIVRATVAARPMVLRSEEGELIAPRGRFSSASLAGELRVELEEGKALLSRAGDTQPVEIHTGTYAIAAAGAEVRRAPMLPSRGGPVATLEAPAGPILGLAASPDGKQLASTAPSGEVHLWDVASRQLLRSLDHPNGKAVSVAWARNGRRLAAGFEPRKGQRNPGVVVWDTRTFKPIADLPLRGKAVPLAFTPDSLSLALAGADRGSQALFVWDVADRRERLILGGRNSRPVCLAVAPNGRSVAAGYRDGKVIFWSLVTGRAEMTLAAHKREVQSLAFSPNGRTLATGSGDGIRLWSLPRGQAGRVLTGTFKEARALAFSPDGRLLASGHGGTVFLWDVAAGQRREAHRAHQFAVTALVFLRDGKTLASAGWDSFLQLWPVP